MADKNWRAADKEEDAPQYELSPRTEPYSIAVEGKYLKIKVKGRGPIVVEGGLAPFRESATSTPTDA